MTDHLKLAVKERSSEGKSYNKSLRRSGTIPGVVYGGKDQPKKISILEKDIVKATEFSGFSTQIIKISLSGSDVDVVVKEIQRHPATSRVIHADFMRVDPDSKITLVVPIKTINDTTCVGVKVSGGQVNHLINDVEVSCLASNLPEYLEIDVQEMDIGDSVLLSGINLPEGVEIVTLMHGEDKDQAVVSVSEMREIIIEEEIEELGEEAEGEGEGEEVEGEDGETLEGEASAEENPSIKEEGSSQESKKE